MPDNFEEKYQKYSGVVYTAAYQYLMNAYAAEDITQEVFVKLFTSAKRFDSDEHEKAWLIRVTINMCKNYLKAKRNRHLSYDEAVNTAVYSSNIDEKLALENELHKLTPAERVCIYLYYYEGYSVRETAKLVKMPEGTVKSHLSRARKTLRINLTKE